VGALGPHRFSVRVDDEPPLIDHDPIANISELAWPPSAVAAITDDVAVPEASVEWLLNGDAQASLSMAKREGWFIYDAAFAGVVEEGDVVEYRIAATDGANMSYDPSGGYHSFTIVPPQPVVIWNPDPTPFSGEAMHQLLTDLSVPHDYVTDIDMPSLVNYGCAFIFLGVFDLNRVLSFEESEALAEYLAVQGDVYMEGGDCWNYDPYSGLYLSLFGLAGSADGTDDLFDLIGIPGTLGDGLSFGYSGENAFMDELMPAPGAEAFFRNPADDRYHAVSCQEGARRTLACSFEFGGLYDVGGPSAKQELVRRYAQFFELPTVTGVPSEKGVAAAPPQRTALLPNYPNPSNPRTEIRFDLAASGRLRLSIYDLHGRLVRRLLDRPTEAGRHSAGWDGRDEAGLGAGSGVYFVRLETADFFASRKLILIR
jgi:hypothetical protein